MNDIFISYSKQDKELVFNICQYLEENGLSCWIAPRNIPPGSEYAAEIIKGIEHCKLFLLMYSDTSNQSQHVLREVGRAVHQNAPIIAYRITKAKPTKSMEYFLETTQWLDAPYKDCITPEALLHAASNILNHQEASVISLDTHKVSPLKDFIHKYSSSLVLLLLVVILCLCVALFKRNSSQTNGSAQLADNGSMETTGSASPDLPSESFPAVTPGSSSGSPSDPPEVSPVPKASTEPSATAPAASNESVSSPSKETVIIVDHSGNNKPFQNASSGTSQAAEPAPAHTALNTLKAGDHLQFGTYYPHAYSDANNDSRLNWIILDVDKSAGTVLCLAANIIDIKIYDGAESGNRPYDKAGNIYQKAQYNSYTPSLITQFFGNSDWTTSNIRTWLNSAQAQVAYKDQPPTSDSSEQFDNGYDKQAGFLHHFSSAEQALIKAHTISTPANTMGSGTKNSTDKVFLLSQSEVKKYLIGQNIIMYAQPTKSASDSDVTGIYKDRKSMGYPNFAWALRTPDTSKAEKVMVVGDGGYDDSDFYYLDAAASFFGIRPAMYISLGQSTLSGDGTASSPYTIN